jgi:hypothetical protein
MSRSRRQTSLWKGQELRKFLTRSKANWTLSSKEVIKEMKRLKVNGIKSSQVHGARYAIRQSEPGLVKDLESKRTICIKTTDETPVSKTSTPPSMRDGQILRDDVQKALTYAPWVGQFGAAVRDRAGCFRREIIGTQDRAAGAGVLFRLPHAGALSIKGANHE